MVERVKAASLTTHGTLEQYLAADVLDLAARVAELTEQQAEALDWLAVLGDDVDALPLARSEKAAIVKARAALRASGER